LKVYIVWFIGVVLWNFGLPEAGSIEVVLVAILLSLLTLSLNKYIK
tara:strand:+ start:388 stop:525 length:138 start_codon:yes stop_codon:yes gene_type:complete